MCAINGLYSYRPTAPAVDLAELSATRDYMAARGPDGQGAWLSADGRLGLGHRRLAIIDLSAAAAQPMASADGRYHLVFNGEIYNHRALRRELEAQGCVFRTHSDTEVILHLFARSYADQGPAILLALRGMFAFALWDSARRQIFLARDPYGIKPLYYADDGGTLRFASQVKALLAGGALSRDPDPAGLVGFHLFGHVPEPFTWYRAIRALPAGHSLLIDERGPGTPVAYHRIAQVYADAEASLDPAQIHTNASASLDPLPPTPSRQGRGSQIKEALLDSVCHHLEADVPVGAFLSAGIDSGTLVGLMRDASARVPALGRGLRRLAVCLLGTQLDQAGSTRASQGQTRRLRHLPPKLPGLLEYGGTLAGAYLLRRGLFMPWELETLLDPQFGPDTARAGLERLDPLGLIQAQLQPNGPRGTFARVATLESSLYLRNQLLRDTDWAGMAHGLEIRVPLVDAHLLAQVAPLTCRAFGLSDRQATPKQWLALTPSRPLPDAIRNRPKTGFGTPLSHWLCDPTAAPGAPPATYGYSRGWACLIAASWG